VPEKARQPPVVVAKTEGTRAYTAEAKRDSAQHGMSGEA
jgi:hypothetical protein